MNIDNFSFIECINCHKIIILPISYENNHTLLSNMCHDYSALNECCDDTDAVFGSIRYGIEERVIKLSDLPIKLRRGFPPEVTHEFACGKHLLIVTKHDGDVVTISVENNIVSMDYNDGNRPRILDILVD